MGKRSRYIPALTFRWLTPVYDLLSRWVMREDRFKRMLLAQAGIQAGERVLDLGCGTGTLTIMLKRMHSQAVAVGLDGDPEVLEIARAKALRAGTDIAFDLGLASELPYPDRSFDTVVSSLVIHHLSRPDKVLAMKQVHRVLKGRGEFHLADFGPPVGAYARVVSSLLRNLEQVGDNLDGRLPWLLRDAGFQDVTRTGRINSVFGTLELLVGAKPLGQE